MNIIFVDPIEIFCFLFYFQFYYIIAVAVAALYTGALGFISDFSFSDNILLMMAIFFGFSFKISL